MTSSEDDQSVGPSSTSGSGGVVRDVGSKIFIGGLSWDVSEEQLKEHFEQYGEILEVVVMKDRTTGRPRGFGFVTYKDPGTADTVVEDVHSVNGKQIDVKKSIPQDSKPKARKIFVGGLGADTSEQDLIEYFTRFGTVVEAQIMNDHISGRSRGFGFVTFEEDESAYTVFSHGMMHTIRGKRVEVKPATPKGSGSQASRQKPLDTQELYSGDMNQNRMIGFFPGIPGQGYAPFGMYPAYAPRPEQMPMMQGAYPPSMQYPYVMMPAPQMGSFMGGYPQPVIPGSPMSMAAPNMQRDAGSRGMGLTPPHSPHHYHQQQRPLMDIEHPINRKTASRISQSNKDQFDSATSLASRHDEEIKRLQELKLGGVSKPA